MDHFQDIFQQAVNLKNTQMLSKRHIFESQPLFIKAGLFYLNKYQNVRAQNLNQKLIVFEILKSNGNGFFKNQEFQKAAHEYEQALSLFRYINNKKENWKSEGIFDEDLVYIDEAGKNPEEINKISELKLQIYLNLSLVYLKIKNYKTAILVANEALKIDDKNPKAYFRRAKAKLLEINSGLKELKEAKSDFELANKYDPKDETIKNELAKVIVEINKLIDSEKNNTFKGIFNKAKIKKHDVENLEEATVYKKNECAKNNKNNENQEKNGLEAKSNVENKQEPKEVAKNFWNKYYGDNNNNNNSNKYDYDLSYEVNPEAVVPKEISELGKFLETKGNDIVKLYERSGKFQEASQLKEKLKIAMKAKTQLEKISLLDFNKPTTQLKTVAEQFDIDLNHPSIKDELIKTQNQNVRDLRAWLDGININQDSLSTNRIKDEEKKQGPEFNSRKTNELITPKIENNYYINNNYYSPLISSNNQYTNNYNLSGVNKKTACSRCKQNNKKIKNSGFGVFLNNAIALLFIVLMIFTIICHYF